MRKFLAILGASLSAALLVAATAVLVQILDKTLAERMTELKSRTFAVMEELIGRRISYESVSPSILQYIEIRNLSIHDSKDSARALFKVSSMRISYNLFRLLFNPDPAEALREIRIENSIVSFDVETDKDIPQLLKTLTSSGSNRAGPPIRFSGANVELRLTKGGETFTLSKLFFTVDAQPDILAVDLRAEAQGSLAVGIDFQTSLALQGRIGRTLNWSDLTLKILSFSSSIASIGAQTFQLVWKDKSLEIRKIQDRSPLDIRLLADLEKSIYVVNVEADGFKPEALIKLKGALSAYNAWLSAPFTVSGTLEYDGLANRLDYLGELSAVLSGQLPMEDMQANVKLKGSEKSVYFETLSLTSATSRLEYTGDIPFPSLYPQGTLVLENFDVMGGGVNGEIVMERRGSGLSVTSEELEIGGISLDVFSASMSADPQGKQRIRMSASLAGTPRTNAIEAEGVLAIGRIPALSVNVVVTQVPADALFSLVSGEAGSSGVGRNAAAILSPFDVTTQASFDTDFKGYTISSRSITFSTTDSPGTDISFSFFADESSLSVSGFSGKIRGIGIKGDFDSRRSANGALTFDSSVVLGETPYLITGLYSKETGLELKGSFGFEMTLGTDSNGDFNLRAKAERLPVPIVAGSQSVSFALEGDFPKNGQWRVTCPSLLFYDIPLPESGSNTAYLTLVLTEKEIRVSRIKFIDDISLLEGSANIMYAFEPNPAEPEFLDGLSAKITGDLSSGTSESYSVRGSIDRGNVDLVADFIALPIKRVGKFALAGELTGSVSVSGPATQSKVSIDAELKKGRLGTDPIVIGASVTMTGERLEVKDLSAKYLSHTLSRSTGDVQLDTGTYNLTTHYLGDFFGDSMSTVMHLGGSAKLTNWESLISNFLDSEVQGTLALSEVKVNAKTVFPWSFKIKTEDSVMYFDGGPFDPASRDPPPVVLSGSIDSKNAFVLHLQSPLPIIGKAEGRIIGDRIQSTLTLTQVDMRVLNAVLKSPVITITSGVLSGKLEVSGPINDPDYTGKNVLLEQAGITCVYAVDPVGPLPKTMLSFNGKTFSFPTVSTTAGKTRVSASGTFTLDHWVPIAFLVNLRTEGETVAHVTGKFGSVRMEGYASGAMKISGDERRMEISGSLLASECLITLGPFQGGKFVPEELPTYVTLGVQIGKRVEFQWPSAEYPLVRATSKPGKTIAITYRGDTGGYTVKGSTEIQGGEVFYFDRSFVMKTGKIILDETEAGFDPRITVRAEVRERDPKTNTPVRIYLEADNKLSLFSPKFSSDPPRSDVEIMAMIGAPIIDRTENQGLLEGTTILVLDPLSQFLILRPFEQKVRTLLGIDSFSLRTQIIPNFLAQKAFGFDVNPLDNTSLSLGKYIGNDLFGEIMVSLHSQETATGIPNINLTWEFNLEWATPLFMLNWNFAPRTPQSLFVPDNSISLNWRFSY